MLTISKQSPWRDWAVTCVACTTRVQFQTNDRPVDIREDRLVIGTTVDGTDVVSGDVGFVFVCPSCGYDIVLWLPTGTT